MTTSASRAPARRPAKKEVAAPNIGEPSGERIALDAASKPEKRIAALGVANGATVVAFLPSACALGGVERSALVVAFVPLAVGLQVSTQKFTVLLP